MSRGGDNNLKTPIPSSIQAAADTAARKNINRLGMALPAEVLSVANYPILSIKFLLDVPQKLQSMMVPIFGPEWIRYPIQVGSRGVVYPASVSIASVTGLGTSKNDWSQPGALTALVFFPCGNSSWSASDDPNKVVIYGPTGVIIRTLDKVSGVTIDETGVTIKGPLIKLQGPVEFDSTVSGLGGTVDFGATNIHSSGTITGDTDVIAGGKSGKTHVHAGVASGGNSTDPPT